MTEKFEIELNMGKGKILTFEVVSVSWKSISGNKKNTLSSSQVQKRQENIYSKHRYSQAK